MPIQSIDKRYSNELYTDLNRPCQNVSAIIGTEGNKAIKSASIASQVISITAAPLPQTSYAASSSVGATETVSLGTNQNGNAAITIGGTKTTGDILTIAVSNLNLSGGQTQISYTVLAGDTLSTIASAIASAISSSVSLQGIGVSATSSGTTINTTMAGTTYTTSTSGGATEILALGPNVQGNSSVAVGGSVTTGNTLTLTVHSPTLPSGQKSVTYTVLGTDTLVTIAAGLSAAINADTSLQALGLTSTNSSAATLVFSQSFVGTRPLPVGASTANVSAVDGANNTKTNGYAMSVNGGSTTNLTFDANGNMTNDGTNSYAWDAENRMIKITYPGVNNFSTFGYDGLSRNISIVETTAGSVTSTKQFVWSMDNMKRSQSCEERDGSGVLTKRFYDGGQMLSTTKYFYNQDDLGSIREMTDSSAVLQAQYGYDSFGRVTKITEVVASDFQFAGYYLHQRSGLSLTMHRSYNAILGRWLSRDPVETKMHDANLYAYCGNSPILYVDPLGLSRGRQKYMPDQWIPCPTGCSPPRDGTPVPYWCIWRQEWDRDPTTGKWYVAASIYFQVPDRHGPDTYNYNNPSGSSCCSWSGPT